jgi:hypothetical protein
MKPGTLQEDVVEHPEYVVDAVRFEVAKVA